MNREPYELDPRMFDGRLPTFANTRSLRVAGGLGTIARVVGDSREIYDRRLPVDEALRRIELYYKPYHRGLRRLLLDAQKVYGHAVLVDCHSMPSNASGRDERPRADVVLGDRYGTSCAPSVTDTIEESLRDLGYAVARNKPYAGGFITEHYGDPAAGFHAVQIEINRALYMDERSYARSSRFERVRLDLARMVGRLASVTAAGSRRCATRPNRSAKLPERKRAACGSKRPKSREETPKEGGNNATPSRYRTAAICQCSAIFATDSAMRNSHSSDASWF